MPRDATDRTGDDSFLDRSERRWFVSVGVVFLVAGIVPLAIAIPSLSLLMKAAGAVIVLVLRPFGIAPDPGVAAGALVAALGVLFLLTPFLDWLLLDLLSEYSDGWERENL